MERNSTIASLPMHVAIVLSLLMCRTTAVSIAFVLLPTRLLLAATGTWQGWPVYIGDVSAALGASLHGHKHLDFTSHAFVGVQVLASQWGAVGGAAVAAALNATGGAPGVVVSATRVPELAPVAAPLASLLLPPMNLEFTNLSVQLIIEAIVAHVFLTMAMVCTGGLSIDPISRRRSALQCRCCCCGCCCCCCCCCC
jgi:hypothetical protein